MRTELLETLADLWRYAENIYLATGEDTLKIKLRGLQYNLDLTDDEKECLKVLCQDRGI